MEGSSESSSGGERSTAGRSKTQIPAATRAQRNQAEKQRRDRLNGYISELATLVPMVSNASKPMDKVSILRLAAAQMRLNFSCLNPKKFKSKPLTLPPAVISYLDVIEKSIGGFVLVTTFSGCIVFCSKSIEDYVGYQNIDIMGNSVYSYIHAGDVNYLEKKVNSVISSQMKGSKKRSSKVIKAHMQQRPLPRSNDVRYRKMIFKISVHLNDTDEGTSRNGQTQTTSSSKVKKTGRPKDYGASAVVLMFIEPVRLEPEIDVTYIESHQDAYFTMHGLKGEIIYADQRISSITGYMPHDVQGHSAYQYISSSDVPIALFAQKAMFTSNDGTGIIVYRLRIRDMRFIYLQSSGQIAYKDSTNEISHFVCFNKLLSDEEGSQELKRFQQRFAPQIMEAKLRQEKENDGAAQIEIPDRAYEQAMAIMNSMKSPVTPEVVPTATQMGIFQSPQNPQSESSSSISGKRLYENFVSSPSTATASCSAHSSDGHSLSSPTSDGGSSSYASEYNNRLAWSFESPEKSFEDQRQFPLQDQGVLLNNSCSTFSISSCHGVNSIADDNSVRGVDNLIVTNKLLTKNNLSTNGSFRLQQNGSSVRSKLKNKTMHSVNAYGTLPNSITVNGTSDKTCNGHPMNLVFDSTVTQKNVPFGLGSTVKSSNSVSAQEKMDGHHNDCTNYNGHVSYVQFKGKNRDFLNTQNSLPLPVNNSAPAISPHNQQMTFDREQPSEIKTPQINDLSSFYEVSNSSLSKIPNKMSVDSGFSDAADFSLNAGSFLSNSSCSNTYMHSNVSYNNGATGDVYNDHGVLQSNTLSMNHNGTNDCEPGLTTDVLHNFPPNNVFNSLNVTTDQIPVNEDTSGVACLKLAMIAYQNDGSDVYAAHSGSSLDVMDWNGTDPQLAPESLGTDINKELFQELDFFFQTLPGTPQDSEISEANPQFSAANSSYLQNSISSSRTKTMYHQ